MTFAYLITVLWTAAALAYRHDTAAIAMTTLAFAHWFGCLLAIAIKFIKQEDVE